MIRCMAARSSASRRGPQCTRRSALAILSISGATLLSACSDSGLSDAPGPSDGLGPTREPDPAVSADVPDAEVLLATLTSTRAALAACSTVADTASQRLTRVCAVIEKQHDVLVRLIEAGSLDFDDRATATSLPGDEAASTGELSEAEASAVAKARVEAEAEAETTVASVLAEQSTGASIVDALIAVSPTNLPTLMALHGQRAAAAEILGAAVTWPEVAGPLGPGAITVVAGLRQAVYGFEILVSRSTKKERETYSAALRPLREASRTVTELAGEAAPVAPLGYGLPTDVENKEERRQLATDLLTALPQAVIAGSAARAGDRDAIAGTLRLMSLSVRLGMSFAVPTAPFPGLTVPDAP